MRNELDFMRPRSMSLFGDWDRFQRQINRLFDDFSSEFQGTQSLEPRRLLPKCDIEDTEDHYVVTVDLPGIEKDQIKVEVSNNVLNISAERKEERERQTKNRYLSERSEGSFYRSLALPSDVDAEHIEAAYENGVLKIAVPKSEATRPRQVKIGSGLSNFMGKLLPKKGREETQDVKIQ